MKTKQEKIKQHRKQNTTKNLVNFSAIFQPEPEGGFTVLIPSLPGCITYGKNLEEARAMGQEAIELYLEVLAETGEQIPADTSPYISTIGVVAPFIHHA